MPKCDPRYRFVYPYLTLMLDSYYLCKPYILSTEWLLLRQGLSAPKFYGDQVYKSKIKVSNDLSGNDALQRLVLQCLYFYTKHDFICKIF